MQYACKFVSIYLCIYVYVYMHVCLCIYGCFGFHKNSSMNSDETCLSLRKWSYWLSFSTKISFYWQACSSGKEKMITENKWIKTFLMEVKDWCSGGSEIDLPSCHWLFILKGNVTQKANILNSFNKNQGLRTLSLF